jgi:hypothetical protein
MPLIFIFVVGMGVALIRRRLVVAPSDRTAGGDVPAQLLGWAVGLLSARRHEWGEAMVGELDRLDGRTRRWRFAMGCVGAALVLAPWGWAAAAVGALTAVGWRRRPGRVHADPLSAGRRGWTWWGRSCSSCWSAISVRRLWRPGRPVPPGGLLLTAAWLAVGRFAFNQMVTCSGRMRGCLWWCAGGGRGGIVVGAVIDAPYGWPRVRRPGVYLYGVLAVAVVGAGGHDPSDGWTDAQVIGDRLGNQVVFYLFALPIMTVAIGWAAAAATARLRGAGAVSASPHPVLPAPGPGSAPIGERRTAKAESRPTWEDLPVSDGPQPGDGATGAVFAAARRHRRTGYRVVLVCAALVAAALLALQWLRL